MLLTRTTPTSRMLSVLALAMFIACGVHGSFFIQENGVLVPSSSEYHAYDDSWSVNFNNVDAVDFDILVFEVCREQPCPIAHKFESGWEVGMIKAFDKKGPHAGKFSVKYKDDPNWWTHSLLREAYGKDKHWVLLGLPSRDFA